MGLSWHEGVQFAPHDAAPAGFASASVCILPGGSYPHLELILSLQRSTGLQVRMRDGTAIRYAISGEGNGPPIALIHSLAMDRHFWSPVVERMKPSATLLSYDCRGHGGSDKPAGPYTIELFADDLHDLLDHVGWASAIVAGASMGGSVALGFTAKYPARLSGLGLFDTKPGRMASPAWSASRKRGGSAMCSERSTPRLSRQALPRSSGTMSPPTPRPATCSENSICFPS
jgi:pimeloyl-ACP methyl ester carboxylesterase